MITGQDVTREVGEYDQTIEDVIFHRTKTGTWVAPFVTEDGRLLLCQVDFNPWTGKPL